MPIFVESSRIGPHDGPNDGASGVRRTVSPRRRDARQQPSLGSFLPFSLYLNPKLRHFDPKSLVNLSLETYLKHIQVKSLNQNLEN